MSKRKRRARSEKYQMVIVPKNKILRKMSQEIIDNKNNRNDFKVAFLLAGIKDSELYKEDGFKSVTAYGVHVLGFDDSTVQDYIRVYNRFVVEVNIGDNGDIFRSFLYDKSKGQDFTFTNLRTLARLTNDEIFEALRTGDITYSMNTSEIQKATKRIYDKRKKHGENKTGITLHDLYIPAIFKTEGNQDTKAETEKTVKSEKTVKHDVENEQYGFNNPDLLKPAATAVNKPNELIKVSYDSEQPTVSGRDLHKALEIDTPYTQWFERMCEYGFIEGKDFITNLLKSTGGRPSVDHQLTIDMAKQLCMIQRTDIGKKCREYFLEVEKCWNSPNAVFARALQLANKTLENIKAQNIKLIETVAVQNQQIAEMQPKVTYYDIVLRQKNAVPITVIAKDYGMSANRMNAKLHEKGIQYKVGGTWVLYDKYADKGYTETDTYVYKNKNGEEAGAHIHMKWTQKGRYFIYETLKADGILPIVEREEEEIEEYSNGTTD